MADRKQSIGPSAFIVDQPSTTHAPVPTPQPVPTKVACSECGLPWGDGHGSLSDCVRLLREALAARPVGGSYTLSSSTDAGTTTWTGPTA